MKIITTLLLLIPAFGFTQTTELFISEYGEGTNPGVNSNNKYIEIYNGTGAAVDLSLYSIKLFANGNTTAASTSILAGTLANGDVYVLANAQSSAAILALNDQTSGVAAFNGNDAVILYKNNVIIDVFGVPGTDPVTSWTIAGNTSGSLNSTVYRKPSVCSPNTDWTSSAGTDATNSEWIIGIADDISNLGVHTSTCGSNPCVTPPAPASTNVSICSGETATLTGTTTLTNSTLAWYDTDLNGTALGTGTSYTTTSLTATTSFWVEEYIIGCPAGPRTQVTVTVNALPTVNAGTDQSICSGVSITLNGAGSGTLTWDNGIANGDQVSPTTTTTYTLTSNDGTCSNTDQITITVNPTPAASATSIDEVTLSASPAGQTYQWYNCTTNQPINGATNATFVATVNGQYAVEVTNSFGCSMTSNCVIVNQVGIPETKAQSNISIYPNPTKGKVQITFGSDKATVTIYNALGKIVATTAGIQSGAIIDLGNFQNGVYMIQVSSEKGSTIQRIIRN